jgi:hypothetical protein
MTLPAAHAGFEMLESNNVVSSEKQQSAEVLMRTC